MKKERWLAGWTRIGEVEFKEKAAEAMKNNPSMRIALTEALSYHGRLSGVPGETIERNLRWIDEIRME